MTRLDKAFSDPRFTKEFWEWFDNLSSEKKREFQEFPADTSELFFYNRVWKSNHEFDYDMDDWK